MASIMGLKLSMRNVGVINTTHTTKRTTKRIQDLKDAIVSSFIIFSQIISEAT
jgi:hypothetical protein